MAVSGYASLVTCATSASSPYVPLAVGADYRVADSRSLLDVTRLGAGVRSRLSRCDRDVGLTLSGALEPSDAGYTLVRAAYYAGTPLVFQVFTSATGATSGFVFQSRIASLTTSGDTDGRVDFELEALLDTTGDGGLGIGSLDAPTTPTTYTPPGSPIIWFDGNDLDGSFNATLTSGVSRVSSWLNKGSLGGAATQATAARQPLYSVNGTLKGAYFDYAAGTRVHFLDFAVSLGRPITVAMIARPTTRAHILGGTYTTGSLVRGLSPGAISASNVWEIGQPTRVATTTPQSLGSYTAAAGVYSATANSILINNPLGTPTTAAAGAFNDWGALRLGAAGPPDGQNLTSLVGDICQVAIWSGVGQPTLNAAVTWLANFGTFPHA